MIDLQTELRHKTDQLAAVREISRAVAEARDLQETLDLITRRATEVMHVESCSIYLYNQPHDKLVLAATTGLNKDGVGHIALPDGIGLTGWAAKHREMVAVDNAFQDARFHRVLGSGESKFFSLMAMPLVSRDKVIGAANVQTVRQHHFTEDEIELFTFITELAATALEKAQLVHAAVVREMHHRVKNNLQTIAMLLRLQMHQDKKLTPQDVLNETVNRVLSIATVHEILSEAGVDKVGLLDLIKRLSTTLSANMINPAAHISLRVTGTNVEMPSQRATGLALVVNELIQNALEHGLSGRERGQVTIKLTQKQHTLTLSVTDDGKGLPPDFDMSRHLNLGLQIVRASVVEDMQGTFDLKAGPDGVGTQARLTLPLS